MLKTSLMPKAIHKIVVKVGTSTLTQGSQKLSRRYMLGLVEQIARIRAAGKEVVLVSSGAIAAGRELLPLPHADRSVPTKQMFASLGQVKLMQTWSDLFGLYDIHVGQMLLTREDFSRREGYLNARDTLASLLQHQILPIVNENDTVATEEIRVGDNDSLAALVAHLLTADLLVLLTDQEGLYTADPRLCTEAELIPFVSEIDESIFALAGGSSTNLGTGGMTTKIEAARMAAKSGTRTVIASSARPNVLIDIVAGQQIGTLFLESQLQNSEARENNPFKACCEGGSGAQVAKGLFS